MGVRIFAAIDVGSYELAMKIFEISPRVGMRQIDHIRHRIDLGSDTYASGKIGYERVEELSRVLGEYTEIMKAYKVTEYQAYGTSAIRETENTTIVLDQIRQRTGVRIDVLSNSEQRFLDYKSIASKGEGFNKIIEKGTAIVDIGGGSIQISLFDKDTLVTTQNMKLGVLRLHEQLSRLNARTGQYEELIEEMVDARLSVFQKMYLKDREIKNIIVVDDYISAVVQKKIIGSKSAGYADSGSFHEFMEAIRPKSRPEIAAILDMPEENIPLLYISGVLLRCIIRAMSAELIWAPGVTLCDGIAYEYAERNKIIVPEHNFEQDIIACAQSISKRYMGSRKRNESMENAALTIYDSMRKVHGLGKRERLLLRIAVLLHDCGKYISMTNLGESSYNIVMSTEIIGLSHVEREIVANIVKYNHMPFEYYEVLGRVTTLERDSYLKIAKLTAILRVANGLARSPRQKFRSVKTVLREDELVITVDTQEDITLERGLFKERADFFEEVYSIRPVIRQKKC